MFELVLRAPEEAVETLADALLDEHGALAVSVEDADAATSSEQALFGEPGLPAPKPGWTHSVVTALFAEAGSATDAATLVMAHPASASVELASLREVADEDWVRVTQAQFAPVEITPSFWVVPTWHERPAQAERVITLDPGLAFGTGTHPTTRMCLRWIARRAEAGDGAWPRVLDYGCGSGILAIAAALHGALSVDAVDIDPIAVEATRTNAQANGVCMRAGLPDLASGSYALVIANILATPLKLLAPLLSSHVDMGGELILAGILERQANELQAAYAPMLDLGIADSEDGWILMSARQPAEPATTKLHGMIPR